MGAASRTESRRDGTLGWRRVERGGAETALFESLVTGRVVERRRTAGSLARREHLKLGD